MHRVFLLGLVWVAAVPAQQYTRGVGVYPGDPKQDWSPTLQAGSTEYRNLALHRPAYHSSSYDYNLTAQLVTDGIKAKGLPRRIAVSTSQQGLLKKNERERLLDGNWVTTVDVAGKSVWVQFEILGGESVPAIDGAAVDATARTLLPDNQQVTCTVTGSNDGQSWHSLGLANGLVRPTGEFHSKVAFASPAQYRFYRVQFDSGRPLQWQIGEVAFSNQGAKVHLAGPYDFTSAWMSAGSGEEWLYVDLGAKSSFDRVNLSWIRRPAAGALEVSDDAQSWRAVHALDAEEIRLPAPVEARYVRLRLNKAESPEGYILSEFEVWGRGGLTAKPKAAAGGLELAGGSWKVQRDSELSATPASISKPGFDDRDWLPATVPGTVLTSYYNAGAIPDPDFGDNQLMISDSFFYANFWYRNEFLPPAAQPGKHVWLNFSGINWKAEVFLNGEQVGRIEGAFTRARFDVTGKIKAGQKNALAVRIIKNATPGSFKEKTAASPDKNGGALGADNPTFHASIGWDWIPTIQGRESGIWNRVFFTVTGAVTVDDPFVSTTLPLPDTSRADVQIEATVTNHEARPVSGTLRGRFGEEAFAVPVSLGASESKSVKQALTLANPRLWWPNGYGPQNLYNVELSFEDSDVVRFQAGVRQFTYSEDGGALRIWVNGRRFIARGGNWGFSESMLRYRAREYETAMRYHHDMHFTMVRNWVGQVGEDEFYDAADRNGIVIMQDFWLANPWDGPDPDDNPMFLRNVEDTLRRIRNHPSIGLYCGRNEGYPFKPLDDAIRADLRKLHPGIQYIPSSADDVVSGHGPYQAVSQKTYFTTRATTKLHSELGMPNIVTMDSLKAMMPESAMWPLGDMWGKHDFSTGGAQGGSSWRNMIERNYGGAKSAAEFVELSQFINYDGYRAMFEAQGKNRMGLLLWMSHPCWPSLVWQTYDYYFDLSAGYFASKKGSEPLHIQWNPVTDSVEVVNYSAGNVTALTAVVEIVNMDGSKQWEKTATLDSTEDSVQSPIKLEYPSGLSPVHFIRLKLVRGGETVSDNFYLRGLEEYNFKAIRDLPKAEVTAAVKTERQGSRWVLTAELRNNSSTPALMVRVKPVRENSGDRILPAIISDNYVALMPGEARTLRIELEDADTRGERPRIVVEGFNLGEKAAN